MRCYRAMLRQSIRGGLPNSLWMHRVKVFWALAVVWVLYLGVSASSRPQKVAFRHSRSLLEASALTGRLEALNFGQHSTDNLREAVQRSISPDFGLLRMREIQDEGLGEYDPLLKSVESITTQLLAADARVPCGWDSSLESDLRQLKGQKILLAANFRNNEELLPHFIVQLWHLLAILPQGTAFVSVYESNSEDSTGAWLEVLRQLVIAMQVPHRIVIGGNLTRGEKQERIDFLAQVRNAALEPLWRDTMSSEGSAASWIPTGPATAQGPFPADRVVFMNDVYLCAKDVVRLLLHRADMVCGMDFDRRKVDHMSVEGQRQQLGKFLHHKLRLPPLLGEMLGHDESILKLHAESPAAEEFYQQDLAMGFYDLWVGRDANGALFLKDEPYATDPYSLQRLPWGLPFPAKCCWNGLVALNSAPFLKHGVKIRSHRQGECAASECSLLCNDFIRLGYQNIVIDPGVRQAYSSRDARDLYHKRWVKGINLTTWSDVSSAPPIDMSLVPFRPFSQCCGLQAGGNMIEFDKDCSWEDVLRPNYTAMPDLRPVAPRNESAKVHRQRMASQRHRHTLLSL